MGTQGEIYVVYGVELPAKVLYEPGSDQNPVVYGVNDRAYCDDEDELPVLDRMVHTDIKYAGIQDNGYGAADLTKPLKLSVRPIGHSGEYAGNMGSRHFKNKALVGYAVCNESYMGNSSPLPPMDRIKELDDRLIEHIKAELGLDVEPEELGLHLIMDWLQGY